MDNQLTIFNYNQYGVSFDFLNDDVLVNATEMAKAFNKKAYEYLRLKETKTFIEALKRSEKFKHFYSSEIGNSPISDTEIEEDYADDILVKVVNGGAHSGTWMHRILALEFASWLNPDFKVWCFLTIDEILFGSFREMEKSLKASAQRRNRMDQVKKTLEGNPDYQELERLELEERQATYRRGKENKNQMDLFRNYK